MNQNNTPSNSARNVDHIFSPRIQRKKETIIENCTLFEFEYNGKIGNVDPYWSAGKDCYLLFFDGHEQIVHTFDEVLHTPFIEEHTLAALIS